MSITTALRRIAYAWRRAASYSADAKAISSGSPERIAKRYVRKAAWRGLGRIGRRINRALR